ncbi:hypothetical protein L3Q67_05400 [Saccharothrix sp. AJ9571]|nr:hypothetical protein L3Q67_05400 [Saccharothrix sp. AJ9571]
MHQPLGRGGRRRPATPSFAERTPGADAQTDELPTGAPGIAHARTDEFEVPAVPSSSTRPRARRFWRGLTGAMAAGLAMLTAADIVIQIYALFVDSPGPGLPSLIGHFVGATAAVVAQRYADRWIGRRAAACGVAVAVLTLATLWFFWWA